MMQTKKVFFDIKNNLSIFVPITKDSNLHIKKSLLCLNLNT